MARQISIVPPGREERNDRRKRLSELAKRVTCHCIVSNSDTGLSRLTTPCRADTNAVRRITDACHLEGEMVAKRRNKRILCFGDSLTQGLWVSCKRLVPYSGRLAQRFKSSIVVNGGVSGETTLDMLGRLPTLLEAGCSSVSAFDIVLILAGTNDLLTSKDRDTTFRNLCTLHAEVHRRNARTAVITLPFLCKPCFQERAEANRRWINASLREFAAQDPGSRLLIDLAAEMPENDAHHSKFWDSDKVHFTQEGYYAIGDRICEALCGFDPSLE